MRLKTGGEIKLNKTKQSPQAQTSELSKALDASLEMARNLKMSDAELMQKMAERIRTKAPHGLLGDAIQSSHTASSHAPGHDMYNPLGGP